ncbi:MAG TPA: MBL fold metallo-hydrolase [Aggregatilineales bacterium]|nr:MBL fold metallo-hydrolase [Chloroflexota bacterium]HOA23974.1 MBL fold metallo-hydrolase [Aggregatilineales bacterium]HPV05715.1 MBL fold metallo-hydrolase [Aggregatilineales bacterium]HQA67074.1 MBL fold metallo-hydrolase [Aggregatilineales bacterium]HQE18819.1 MBL fold metallo-hydrolase [Aggregatilineales bacterium]
MDITWYGLSCFRMIERGVVSIITDPYDASIGLGEPNLRADIVTVSHDAPGHNAVHTVKRVQHTLTRPGEYEISGVFITGVQTYNPDLPPDQIRRNIIFVYDFGNFTIAHLGDLDHVPSQSRVEKLGPIDVLLVPVGGGSALNSAQAAEVISLIEPGIVVPMHYKVDGCKLDLDPLDKFLAELGISGIEEQDSLSVRGSSSTDETEVVILKPMR